jgi:hypothetical protein
MIPTFGLWRIWGRHVNAIRDVPDFPQTEAGDDARLRRLAHEELERLQAK